jgi:hypothetical protein
MLGLLHRFSSSIERIGSALQFDHPFEQFINASP